MSHVRKQIRDAVAAKVDDITDFGTTSPRVYTDRVTPDITLPSARVLTSDEETLQEYAMGASGVYTEMRRVMVTIEIRASAKTGLDDTLDGLCVKVEEKVMSDDTLGGLVKRLLYQGTRIELNGELEKPVGIATITYLADYRVAYNEPEVAIA